MALFEIEGADGVIYEVDAPNEASAVAAFKQYSGPSSAPPPTQRGWGDAIYDNLVGDPTDGVQSYGEDLGTWLNRAGESMTLGVVGDEATAAVTGMLPGRSYDGELDRYRKNEDGMSTMGRLSADLFGGLVPAAMGVGAVSGATSVGRAMGRGAALGGGAGAVQGFMEGEGGVANRALSGGVGMGIGMAAGGLIPAVAHGAKSAWRGIKEGIGNTRMARSAGDVLGIRPETARALSDTLGIDDPNAIGKYLDDAGTHAMLADASPSAAGALDAAMQTPGRAARVAHERVSGRAAQSASDLNAAMDTSLGAAQGATALADDIRLGSAPARKAAYDAAYAAPIDYTASAGRRIEGLLSRVPDSAIRRANELMALEGNKSAQIMAQIGDDGAVKYLRMPDVRQLDYITRAMNDVAAAADGQGKLGGTTALGRAIGSLAKDIRGAVKEAVPEYRAALDVASDAISERNALDIGMDIFKRSTTREDIAEAVKGATKPEIAAMKRGARSFIDEQLANVRATISDHSIEPRQAMEALRQLSSPASQEKMRALLGEDWGSLRGEIDKASRALSLRAATSRNSATFGRTAANAALDQAIEPSLLRQGKPVAWAKDAISTAAGASKSAVNRLRADSKAELADILTRQGFGPEVMRAIEAARAKHTVGRDAGQTVGLIGNLLGFSALPRSAEGASQGLLSWLQAR